MIPKNFRTLFPIKKNIKNSPINRGSRNKPGEQKKSIESQEKNREKGQIGLGIQEEEEEKSIRSTEYEERWKDHQPSFR